eukprot:g1599.t1
MMDDPLSAFVEEKRVEDAKSKAAKKRETRSRTTTIEHEIRFNPFLSTGDGENENYGSAPRTNTSDRKNSVTSSHLIKRATSHTKGDNANGCRSSNSNSLLNPSLKTIVQQNGGVGTQSHGNGKHTHVIESDPYLITAPRLKQFSGSVHLRPERIQKTTLFPGETTLMKMKVGDCFFASAALRCEPGVPGMVAGEFSCSTFQLQFIPTHAYDFPPGYFNVPLACIQKIELHNTKNGRKVLICLKCKDLRTLVFGFKDENTRTKALQTLSTMAFPHKIQLTFCFFNNLKSSPSATPKGRLYRYDFSAECKRLGVISSQSPFERSLCNTNFRMSPTYPEDLLRPRKFTEASMWQVAAFRSKARLPAFTWCFPKLPQGPSLWRCSQPKVGIGVMGSGGNRCREDEMFLACIRTANKMSQRLLIADCRSKAAAYGNAALKGYGVENISNYSNCSIRYLGIGNIHKMRSSLASLGNLLQSTPSSGTDLSWLKAVEETEWPYHVRNVLSGAISVAKTMYLQQEAVVVHCSDGWDRTAQVCSLVQMLLDPYCRTLEGFLTLIQKEWLSFGYKFQDRTGHALKPQSEHSQECSPVFLQFLDCTWQLLNQYPKCFEFNGELLVFIAHHLYSCAFGTFLGNNIQERRELGLHKTPCLWTEIVSTNRRKSFLNPFYTITGGTRENGKEKDLFGEPDGSTVLLPYRSTVVRNYTLWSDYFYRWCSVPSHSSQLPPLSRPEGTKTEFCSARVKLERMVHESENVDSLSLLPSPPSSTETERKLLAANSKIKQLEQLVSVLKRSTSNKERKVEVDNKRKSESEDAFELDIGDLEVNVSMNEIISEVDDLLFENANDKDAKSK